MSIHERLAAVADELHLTGFGCEMNEALSRVSQLFADEIHARDAGTLELSPAVEAAIAAAVQSAVDAAAVRFKRSEIDGAISMVNTQVDRRVEQILASKGESAPAD